MILTKEFGVFNMEVKVKKSLLFNVLKKSLSENRTNDNPGGNFVHPFDRGETPIAPSAHMTTQLSVEEPPVSDPDFIPASMSELRASAARISQEVPPEQVEFFYRSLHKLLDASLDRSNPSTMAEGFINLLSESMDFYQQKIDKLAAQLKEDPYFDIDEAVDEIMNNADVYGLDPALVDPMQIQNDIIEKAEGLGGEAGAIATAPTPAGSSFTPAHAGITSQDRGRTVYAKSQDEDLPELSDDEMDAMLASDSIGEPVDRDTRPRGHRALSRSYWDQMKEKIKSGEGYPLEIASQVVMDSMDAVSRIIGTQVAISQYGYGGAGTDSEEGSAEASSWKGVLSNTVNTNPEVVYKLPAKKKTEQFWNPVVMKFIQRMESGNAGSLSEFKQDFWDVVGEGYAIYEKESGLPMIKFINQIASRVTETILYHSDYGALTRNVAADESTLLAKTIDTGFSAQIKKEPFNIPTKTTFRARGLDPSEVVEHAGEEKPLRQAIIDAVVAYAIVKSDEFKTERKSLDADLDNEARDSAIQNIISGLSENEMFTFTSGTGRAKAAYEISKVDIVGQVEAYVDSKFEESEEYAQSRDAGEELTDDEIAAYLEDESVSEAEKKEAFTDAVAAQIMGTESSAASFRDYDYRVLSRKQKMAFDALNDDVGNSEHVNYVNVYNDIMSELAPTAEAGIKELQSTGINSEEVKLLKKYIPYYDDSQVSQLAGDVINAASSEESGIPAVTRIVYAMPEKIEYEGMRGEVERDPTRGGETLLQNIGEADLDFLVDSGAAGPNIVRHIVGSIMGKTLRGGGLKKIADIDFNRANEAVAKKVVRSAVEIEKELLRLLAQEFTGINLSDAQNSAYETAVELGMKESKAKFLEKNMQDFQIKTIYPFVGRVKRMPDFNKMNPAAKNYVCWFTSIADKAYGGAATLDERKEKAREIFEKLKSIGENLLGGKREEVSTLTSQIDDAISVAITSEIEGIKQYSDDIVRKLTKDKSMLRDVLVQSIGMHLQDISR